MLDKNDIQILRGMFRENNDVLRREIRDETRAIVRAETGEVRKEIQEMREEFVELLNEHVLQPIAELQTAVFPAR